MIHLKNFRYVLLSIFKLIKNAKNVLAMQHGVEENIWTEDGRGNGGMEDIA